jgi:hypothetical protein
MRSNVRKERKNKEINKVRKQKKSLRNLQLHRVQQSGIILIVNIMWLKQIRSR